MTPPGSSVEDATRAPGRSSSRSRGSSLATTVLAVVLAALCLWYALRGLDGGQLRDVLAQARVGWLVGAAVTLAVSYVLRSLRLAVILPGGTTRGTGAIERLFWATTIGYLLNTILPARAGDVARAGIAARATRSRMSTVLGCTLLERAGDVLVLSAVMALAVPTIDGLPDWLLRTSRIGGMLVLLMFAFVYVVQRRQRGRADDVSPVTPSFARRIGMVALQFVAGVGILRGARGIATFGTFTAAIWLVDTCVALQLGHAFGVELSAVEAIVLLGALGLASSAPSTPGYVGVFQAVGVAVLGPMDVSDEAAIVIVTALQVVTLLVTATLGGMGMLRLGTSGVHVRQHSGEVTG